VGERDRVRDLRKKDTAARERMWRNEISNAKTTKGISPCGIKKASEGADWGVVLLPGEGSGSRWYSG